MLESLQLTMVDDYATMLANEQGNPNAILLQILGDNYEDWDFIVAVEGPNDRCFYFDFIREIYAGKSPKFFECGGKNRLLQFRTSAESYDWSAKPCILYLCDKDFDDFLGTDADGVFRTNVYSIESYFAGTEFVEYIVEKHCVRPLAQSEKNAFIEQFCRNFRRCMLPLRLVSAVMCEVRASGLHPQFDDCSIDKLFDVGDGKIVRKVRSISRICKTLNVDSAIYLKSALGRTKQFEMPSFKSWVRGKLALQITRKVYDISRSSMPHDLKEKLPASNHFGSDAFRTAKPFLGSIPGLQEYCIGTPLPLERPQS